MVWNSEKDETLCREILLFEPYQFKERTRERGNAWKSIAENLNAIDCQNFRVDSRAVRERFFHIKARFERQTRDDNKATGISPEVTLLDQALQDISDRIQEAEANLEHENKTSKERSNLEKLEAEEIRNRAVENLGETMQRKRENSEGGNSAGSKRHRSTGTDTLQYLREKGERDQELRVRELDLRQQENSQQQSIFSTMLQQMQTQNQQMMTIMMKFAEKNSQ